MPQDASQTTSPKIALIIDCTLQTLREEGSQGLSMRKVAARAGMSLGNLQYYFKNKDELLKGMVGAHFERCNGNFREHQRAHPAGTPREIVQGLVVFGIEYADSESGKVFRELWGIASQNEVVNAQLHEYYQLLVAELTGTLTPFGKSPQTVAQAVSLLIPYFAGYDLTAKALPLNGQETISLFSGVVLSILEGGCGGE